MANGQPLGGIVAARVRSNNYFAADSFELTVASSADATSHALFYSSDSPIDIDVQLRTDSTSSFISVLQGQVDQMRLDPIARAIQIEGRDYSAALIDSIVCETYANRTASEIAVLLAQRHGLQPKVDPTTAIIGRYYQNEHDAVLLDRFCGKASEWDLLSYLAQQEGFDLFVTGTTLNFVPEAGATASCWTCTPDDLLGLHLNWTLGLARDIEVSAKTWNSRQHMADVQTARRTRTSPSNPAVGSQTTPRRIALIRPNLTSDAALQLARRRLEDLCRQERTIELIMPGEVSLTPRNVLLLQGTDSDFDRPYRIDTIDRRFSSRSGFEQRIRASTIPDPTQFS